MFAKCTGLSRGDVVLDNFNNVSRDGDNILEQIHKKQMCSDFYFHDFEFS